jgi:integrase
MGTIKEARSGVWRLRFDGPDRNGERQQKQVTFRGTKRAAERELARLETEVGSGSYVAPVRETVAEFLERWLEAYAKTNTTARTFQRYSDIVRGHLVPALGQLTLTKLQPLHIQEYYSEALATGRRDGNGGLSAKTVLHHHRVLREALKHAVKWRLIAVNPADATEPPRPQPHEIRVLSEDEVARLIDAAKGTPLAFPILVALSTGLRRGEILALRWEDIDLQRATLAVRQSLEETRDGIRFKVPKTKKSRRVVALPAALVEALVRHKGEQAQHRLMIGPDYRDHGLVIARPDGTPVRPNYITLAFTRLSRRCELHGVRFHDLRHTHATELLRQGIHPKVVSERLGHATVGMTLDVYSHVLPDMQEEAARRIDQALRAVMGGGAG